VTDKAAADPMRAVRLWLWLVAVLVALIVLVGGATRLTGSGLSITEWQPISGILPPLSESAWLSEFEKYRRIPQFVAVNPGMTLAEFKFIYWWEWTHRFLGRLVGLVFLVPFLVFWWRGLIGRALGWKLAAIFALGALQGAIGWWMVQSGLTERTDVSQYRLAVHLTLASVILSAIVWVAVRLAPRHEPVVARRHRVFAAAILALVLVQIFLGALVAKTSAGLTFNTWPLIGGWFIPPAHSLFVIAPAWRNFFENVLMIQFQHRMAAYALFVLALWHAVDAARLGRHPLARRAIVLFALVALQTLLGIVTLLLGAPLWLALAHQAGAAAVLVAATVNVASIARDPVRQRSARSGESMDPAGFPLARE
jgi:cytochrome c oxidase assembly protein subunit 15